nr:immunoglobulin light chain junction region [Macaca mulatta]
DYYCWLYYSGGQIF